jgi:hypothetical protein
MRRLKAIEMMMIRTIEKSRESETIWIVTNTNKTSNKRVMIDKEIRVDSQIQHQLIRITKAVIDKMKVEITEEMREVQDINHKVVTNKERDELY